MGARKQGDLFPGTLELLILRTLARGHMHGYGIAQMIKQISDDVLEVEEGSLYPALQRLELQGLIDSEWGVSANNRRAKYYRLNAGGRKRLAREVPEFHRMMHAIARVLGPA